MVVIVVKEPDGDGAVVIIEEDCGGSEGGVSGGVGVWEGSCDKNKLELEGAKGGEDRDDITDEGVPDDDVSYEDVCFDDEPDSERVGDGEDGDVGGLCM